MLFTNLCANLFFDLSSPISDMTMGTRYFAVLAISFVCGINNWLLKVTVIDTMVVFSLDDANGATLWAKKKTATSVLNASWSMGEINVQSCVDANNKWKITFELMFNQLAPTKNWTDSAGRRKNKKKWQHLFGQPPYEIHIILGA